MKDFALHWVDAELQQKLLWYLPSKWLLELLHFSDSAYRTAEDRFSNCIEGACRWRLEWDLPIDIFLLREELSGCIPAHAMPNFRLSLIDAIARRCSQVTYLDLSFLTDLTTGNLCTFIRNMSYLKVLKLMNLQSVDEQVLKTISRTSGHLETLAIPWCRSLTDDGLKHLYSVFSMP